MSSLFGSSPVSRDPKGYLIRKGIAYTFCPRMLHFPEANLALYQPEAAMTPNQTLGIESPATVFLTSTRRCSERVDCD